MMVQVWRVGNARESRHHRFGARESVLLAGMIATDQRVRSDGRFAAMAEARHLLDHGTMEFLPRAAGRTGRLLQGRARGRRLSFLARVHYISLRVGWLVVVRGQLARLSVSASRLTSSTSRSALAKGVMGVTRATMSHGIRRTTSRLESLRRPRRRPPG